MNAASPLPYSSEQIVTWLRGLVTIAWADGQFSDAEQAMIENLVASELAPDLSATVYEPISAEQLAQQLGTDDNLAENFLRTAVMVALADGVYSTSEDEILEGFCQSLRLEVTALDALRKTLDGSTPVLDADAKALPPEFASPQELAAIDQGSHDLLSPMRTWLDGLEMHDPRIARFLCQMIPPQCPFERDVQLFGRKVVHIPPLCKLNPLYEQLVGLRFRALSYLADDCKEDVSRYC